MAGRDTYPLPDDPRLAEVAGAMNGAGHWGWVTDHEWRLRHVTDQLRLTFGGNVEFADFMIGDHLFGPRALAATKACGASEPRRRSSSG